MHGIDTIKFPENLYIPSTIKYKQLKKKLTVCMYLGNVKKVKVIIKGAELIRQCALIDWSNGELDKSEARKLGSCELSYSERTEICQ